MQNFEEDSFITDTQGVSAHAGFPNPATDAARQGGLDLHKLLIQNDTSTFLMRITGAHWQHFGIFDGDIAIIDKALSPHPTDLVIWWHDGDFAISERVRMRPEATIWGVVTAVVHQFRTHQEASYEAA